MSTDQQPALPGITTDRPAVVECAGTELQAICADVRARGATIAILEVVGASRWRLRLAWPSGTRTPLERVCAAHRKREENQKQ